MRFVIVSDNHGDQDIIRQIINYYHNDAIIIHAGDSELKFSDPLVSQMNLVEGNMDIAQFNQTILLDENGYRVLVTHGHRYGVNYGLLNLKLLAIEKKAKMVVYRHTHQLSVAREDGILFINPGSISQPRGQYAALGGTYAVVESNDQLVTADIQYYDRELMPVTELHFQI